jgi:hypothetical protein
MTEKTRFSLYCDESNIQAAHYMLIGGLWIPQKSEADLRGSLTKVRQDFNMTAEFKWTKVSQSKLPAYSAWLDCFFDNKDIGFRCIVIDTNLLDYRAFHKGDQELGFYKFYYQLVSRNIKPENLYWLYTDERTNRKKNRLEVLKIVTNHYWMKQANVEPLRSVEPRCSHDEDFLQLADVLLGALGYTWNMSKNSPAKMNLITHITKRLNWTSLRVATSPSSTRFNIWQWRPSAQSQVKSKRPCS